MITTETETDFIARRLDAWVERGLRRLGDKARGAEPIRELHLELTHRCNQRCVMCHHWGIPARDPGARRRELGAEELRTSLSRSTLLDKVEVVVLTGGEPWLRKDLGEIAGFLAKRFPRARLGVLSNLADKRMVRAGLRDLEARGARGVWLGTSLDGLERTHDRVRGRKGAFRGLMDTVRMLQRERPRTDVSFNYTITPENHKELWPAYGLAKGLGAWFGAQLVVNHRGLQAPKTFVWTKRKLAAVRGSIDRIFLDICRTEGAMRKLIDGEQGDCLGLWTRLLYWRCLRAYAAEPKRLFMDCLAGRRYAMLDPEGRLFFCPVNKHRRIGGLKERSFDALWRSPEARRERRFMESGRCHCCLTCVMNPVLDRLMSAGVPS